MTVKEHYQVLTKAIILAYYVNIIENEKNATIGDYNYIGEIILSG